MTTPPQNSSSSGDDRNLVPVDENYLAPTFEDRLGLFWAKHSRTVLAACAVVLGAIVFKGAYEIIAARREKAVSADYAAATTDAQLKTFATDHGTHVLGGLAQLRLADQAYAAGNHAEARSLYEKAVSILKDDTFGQRARLGAAVAAVLAGAVTEGESSLKQIAADLKLGRMVRSEAAYHLAGLAASAGRTDEAVRLIEQVISIDADGQWAERASMLRATLPASAPTASVTDAKAESTPTVSFK
jgi:tetratricopeptide (TPR) repeat protein